MPLPIFYPSLTSLYRYLLYSVGGNLYTFSAEFFTVSCFFTALPHFLSFYLLLNSIPHSCLPSYSSFSYTAPICHFLPCWLGGYAENVRGLFLPISWLIMRLNLFCFSSLAPFLPPLARKPKTDLPLLLYPLLPTFYLIPPADCNYPTVGRQQPPGKDAELELTQSKL